jgi:hypothetical protein
MSDDETDSKAFDLIRMLSNRIGIICYCTTSENLLVWSHYGNHA